MELVLVQVWQVILLNNDDWRITRVLEIWSVIYNTFRKSSKGFPAANVALTNAS